MNKNFQKHKNDKNLRMPEGIRRFLQKREEKEE